MAIKPNSITSISQMPAVPSRDYPDTYADLAEAWDEHLESNFQPELNALSADVEAHSDYIEATAAEVERDKNDAANYRTQALQSSQSASNDAQRAEAALNTAIEARDATVLAASEVGALVLADAQRVVRLKRAEDFGLSLL